MFILNFSQPYATSHLICLIQQKSRPAGPPAAIFLDAVRQSSGQAYVKPWPIHPAIMGNMRQAQQLKSCCQSGRGASIRTMPHSLARHSSSACRQLCSRATLSSYSFLEACRSGGRLLKALSLAVVVFKAACTL